MQLHFGLNIQKLSGLGLAFANDLLSPREPKTQHNIYQTTDENFTYIFLCHLLMLAMCKLNFQNVTLTCWFLRRLPFRRFRQVLVKILISFFKMNQKATYCLLSFPLHHVNKVAGRSFVTGVVSRISSLSASLRTLSCRRSSRRSLNVDLLRFSTKQFLFLFIVCRLSV